MQPARLGAGHLSARTAITRERVRIKQRLEKVLEDAGIKLSLVASDITGTSGRTILAAMVAGERDPAVLADLSVRTLRAKIPQLEAALAGRFSEHHAFLVATHLRQIEQHDAAIASVSARIEELMVPFRHARDLIMTILRCLLPDAPGHLLALRAGEAVRVCFRARTGLYRLQPAGHCGVRPLRAPGTTDSPVPRGASLRLVLHRCAGPPRHLHQLREHDASGRPSRSGHYRVRRLRRRTGAPRLR